MDHQRPPSSRPKSSKPGEGRPKTAGRNADRPLTSAVGNRLASRAGTSLGGGSIAGSTERPASRGVSSLGARPTSRLMTGSAAAGPRPGSRSIPLVSDRPITQQQGMGGVRASSRMGTGRGRQIADKSYYLGLLNRQLAALEAETDALSVELERTERDQQNLAAYEQRAEEQADELKGLQGELADYNTIIDRQNANADLLRELEFELGEVASSNKELGLIVEQTFKERKEKEDQARDLEAEISRPGQTGLDIEGGNMTADEREEYVRVRNELQSLKQQVAEKNQQLETLLRSKDEMDMLIGNSALKQQAMALNDQLYSLEQRERTLKIASETSQKAGGDPSRDESLVDKIRADNEEIEEMQHLLEQVQERVGYAEEELAEFRNESQLLHGERSEKFRELKNRDMHMEHFFDSFPVGKQELDESISKLSANIVRLLRLISINCRHSDNMGGGVDESALSFGGDNGGSGVTASELQDLHLRLQEELVTLDANESALHVELDGMKRKQEEIDATKDQLNDLQGRREELTARKKELEERRRELASETATLEGENGRTLEQVDANERRLSTNAHYSKMKDLKRRNETDEEERKEVRAKLAQRTAEYDYENVKQEALRLRAQYNLLLIASAGDQ